jgi:predicted transposase YdaD
VPKPFDATLKGMLQASPQDWAALAGHPATEVRVVDTDISTFTGAADKVLQLGGNQQGLLHFEFQAGPDATLPRRLCVGNALLEHRHELPVWSVAVLLRPQAKLANLTGLYERSWPGEDSYLSFRYGVVLVWELPPERFLQAGPGTLPLAPISAVKESDVPGVIGRMKDRLRRRPRAEARDLWTAAYVLLGLRHAPGQVARMFEGVVAMEESSTYQVILREGMARGIQQGLEKGLREGRLAGQEEGRQEGAVEEIRRALLLLGASHFKTPPGPDVRTALESNDDIGNLEQLLVRLPTVNSWAELVHLPSRASRKRRKS